MKKMNLLCSILFFVTLTCYTLFCHKRDTTMKAYTKDLPSIIASFPASKDAIEKQKTAAMQRAEQDIAAIIAVPASNRTFENTFGAYDKACAHFGITSARFELLHYVSPDKEVREAAEAAGIALSAFAIEKMRFNTALYAALKEYAQDKALQEEITADQRYFIAETLKGFKRSGLELPLEKQQEVKTIKKKLSELSVEFSKNIAEDASFITATKDELQGLEDDCIANLPKIDEGTYKLGTDYPTYSAVMQFCSVAQTRKKMYEVFVNRAYPKNKQVLENIIAHRDALAHLLGYASYAELNLEEEMVKTPERAQEFLEALVPKAQEKEREEFMLRIQDLPLSVELSNGKMFPWDGAFAAAYHKKKYYNLDERLVSEYFPMDSTIAGLLDVYKSFFALDMVHERVAGAWHEDVTLIKLYSKVDQELLGYIFLDLHPRPNKFSHACHITIVPATRNEDGCKNPSVAVVIANFPKPQKDKPALLKRSDVNTFFHEFGHAIHALMGSTAITSFAGTSVKTDFVEMPSQMLEYWLFDRDILKMIGRHYITGEPLPDAMIDTIIQLKNFGEGAAVTRQLALAQLSLHIFGSGADKDLDALMRKIWGKTVLYSVYDDQGHFYSSFGHLTDYGARYYGYMWSKVFAADLFYAIKPHGLLNPEVGVRYAQTILAPGGSIEPDELIKNFLGREPNQEAFLKDLGFAEN